MSACVSIPRESVLLAALACTCSFEPDYPDDDPLADCGDGQLAADEECDDGNRDDGDGCSAECLHRGSVVWTQVLDGPSGAIDCGEAIALTPTGELVIAGFMSAGDTRMDMWVAAMTADGELLWSRTSDGGADYLDTLDDVVVAADGTIYVVGSKYGSPEGVFADDQNTWIEALTPDGERLWGNTVTGDPGASNVVEAMALDGDGFVATGYQSVDNREKLWVFKVDATGDVRWQIVDDDDLSDFQLSLDIAVSPDRDVYMIGFTRKFAVTTGDPVFWLSRRSSTGDKIWTRELATARADSGSNHASLAIDSDGSVWVAYETDDPGDLYATDVKIERRTPDGTVTYEDLFRGPANRDDNVEALAIGPTGAIVLAGDTYVDGKRANIWLQAYDPGPAVAWTRMIGDVGADSSHAVTADADHVYATGCVGNQDLPSDAWVARLVL